MKRMFLSAVLTVSICILLTDNSFPLVKRVKGQTVYSSVYSHIYYGDRENFILLSSTITIRNTDRHNAITLISVDYYDTKGVIVEKLQAIPLQIAPLETIRFVIKESDTRGGSGAKCLIRWKSDISVNEPLIETIMIGTRLQQGISFSTQGVVIEEIP